jgi:uncharacterized repeat protein (TIGR01451 family)
MRQALAFRLNPRSLLLPTVLLAFLSLFIGVVAASAQTADLAVVQTVSAPVVAAGTNVTYTAVVSNNGPNAATNAVFYENIPASTTFQSIGTVPAGWTCTVPAVNGNAPISCTNASFANGATSTFTITLKVIAGTAAETTISSVSSVTSNSTPDPTANNNTSTALVLVGITGDADLALAQSAAPNPVFVSSPMTYTVSVQNLGVAAATATSVSDTLPAQVTYVSATATQGSCTQAAGVVTCSLGMLNPAATATIAISVTAPGTSGTLTNTATASSTVTDPFSANNSATLLAFVQPLACGNPAQDGAGGTLTGIVNTYYPPSAASTVASGATSLTLGAATGSSTPIAAGDRLLVIQMQDASINSTNTGSYGDGTAGEPANGVTNLNSSGRYEFVTATNGVPLAGGTLNLSGAGPGGGVLNPYTSAAYSAGVQGQRTYQVIRVPQFQSATLSSGLVPAAWNGSTGGVLAIDVAGQLTLGGTVSGDGLGFRGGAGRKLGGGTGSALDYITLATDATNGSKGEGIAGTPRYIANAAITGLTDTGVEGLPNGSYARGAPGNAGGGGTDANPAANNENSGGGGGGNGSAGGNGGYAWNTASLGNGAGGSSFSGSVSALIMGGGAGAGTSNDGTSYPTNVNPAGINSSGAAGGAIIIIHAGSVVGTGTITANGQSALNVQNDGAGGGAAGGSIELLALSGSLSGATLSANGGNGGNTWQTDPAGTPYPGNRHGPGGGGGGGVIVTTSAPAVASVLPGVNGTSTMVGDPYGSTPGLGNGIASTAIGTSGFTQTPGVGAGAECSVADLAVTNAGAPNPVAPGANITYTQTVTNNGPQSASNVVFSEGIPSNTTFVSFTSPAAWTCTTPAAGGTGNISCTLPVNNINVLSSFTLVVQVGAATPSGTTISDTDTVSSSTNDSNLANNTATVNILVANPASADISVTNTAAPTTVAPSNNITYTQTLTNGGPATATNVAFAETVPTNTTLVSFTAAAGWTCSWPGVGGTGNISCSIATLASGIIANFALVVKVNAGTAAGTVISDTDSGSSTISDPDSSNNSATANVTVALASQADLAVTKTATPDPVLAGNNITYTVTVTNNGPSAASTVVLTDTLSTSTTYVSSGTTPAGWTCVTPAVGSTGAIVCSNASVANGASATFTFVAKVIAGTAPATVITNSVGVSTTTTDPTSANNTATASVTVTSPSQADMAITMIATPEPVTQGNSLVYALTISNNGPASADNVVVTDTLPSAVTYVSSLVSGGSCSQSSGTVTCNMGSMSNGQVAIITHNVLATTFSSASYAVNTATVSASTSDPDLSNNTATTSSTIAAPTAVQLASFHAVAQSGGGTLLEWHTREEIRNLGFHVYREDAQGRRRLTPSLVAGSALLMRGGRPQHAAKTYQWLDPDGTANSVYYLEDVDLNGSRNMHGPAYVDAVSQNTAPVKRATLLTEMNRSAATSSALPSRPRTTRTPAISVLAPGEVRASLEGVPAVKISVSSEGWYRVSIAQLLAAGLDPDADPRTLQLFAEGVEQPMFISSLQSGRLSADGVIEFYGSGIDTPYSNERVYWLVRGTHAGKRIAMEPRATPGSSGPQSFLSTTIREDRTTYLATLLNGEDADNFFGAVITSEPVDQPLTVAHIAANSGIPASVDVTLQGATDSQPHRVSVTLNGAFLAEMDFANLSNFTQTFPVPPGLLQEGANTVTLTALAGDNDVSLVQSIALHYPHLYTADGNWLQATAAPGSTVRIDGFSNAMVRVFDVTDALDVAQLSCEGAAGDSSYGVTCVVPGAASPADRTLLAFSVDQISSPAGLAAHKPSALAEQRRGPQLLIISHPDFVSSLGPLVQLHESQGLATSVVTIDQLFDAFNFGERSPYAIRDYLQHAASTWQKAPEALLLVGDASVDPCNYLGLGDFDFVPTRIIETPAFKTASDDWFSDFLQTGFATIPTGRLPVRTPADAALVVGKIVNYEKGIDAGNWNQQAVIVADQNVDSNFTAAANFAATDLPAPLTATKILTDGLDTETMRQQISTALNNGALLVNYAGHGSVEQWSFSDLLDDSSASALSNGNRLPFYLLMDCLNGFFQDVYSTSLAESLLLAPNGGAVGVWASSGFTEAAPQATMDQAMLHVLATNQKISMGRAIIQAKAGITDPDVRRTWILFGDPTMQLQIPWSAVPASNRTSAAARVSRESTRPSPR